MHNTLPLRAGRDRLRPVARLAWWGLPWLVLLTISASAAYGMTVAVAGTESVENLATTPPDAPGGSGSCDVTSAWILQNAVANGWVPAKNADYCTDKKMTGPR
jgi:hypothetical protein